MGRLAHFLVSAIVVAALAGCGKTRTGVIPPKEEAVTLMDKGQNAKAARVLEETLERDPDDDEAKRLLASAYMGLAGIDVYRIFDAFSDLIFKRSLKDQIIAKKDEAPAKPPLANGKLSASESDVEKKDGKSKPERAMDALNRAIRSLQLALIYLDRFPQIPEESWPLVEAALARLESMRDPSVDAYTYRILIRMIYSKSYLVERVMRNEQLWTREWACRFDAQDFDEDLGFFVRQALAIDEELGKGAEKGSKALAKARKNFAFLGDAANSAEAFSAWNDGLTFSELENSLKGMFHCN